MSVWCWLLCWMSRMWQSNMWMLGKLRNIEWINETPGNHCCLSQPMFRMLLKTKIGTIAWIPMVKAWHAAFIIVKIMNRAKLIALDNSKWKRRIVPARFVGSDWILERLIKRLIYRIFQANCKGGCPCESYECNELTTTQASTTSISTITTAQPTKEAVLLLSTRYTSNVPMVIDFEGRTLTINVSLTVSIRSANFAVYFQVKISHGYMIIYDIKIMSTFRNNLISGSFPEYGNF